MSNISRRNFELAMMGSLAMKPALSTKAGARDESSEQPARSGSITDVAGIRVGHFTDSRRLTGCIALLFDGEAAAGVDYDGSAPGSYPGVLLQPVSPIETIHGLLLTGGGNMGQKGTKKAIGKYFGKKSDLQIPCFHTHGRMSFSCYSRYSCYTFRGGAVKLYV
jgi:peptidase S58-like protein